MGNNRNKRRKLNTKRRKPNIKRKHRNRQHINTKMNLTNSQYTGTINGEQTAKQIDIK